LNDDKDTPRQRSGSADSVDSASQRGGRPRGRYRRRGSVTKYSLDTADEVKKEYDEHEDMINKFRNAQISDQQGSSLSTSERSITDPETGEKKKVKKKRGLFR